MLSNEEIRLLERIREDLSWHTPIAILEDRKTIDYSAFCQLINKYKKVYSGIKASYKDLNLADLKSLREEGKSISQIARKYKVSISCIEDRFRAIRSLGL